MKVFISFISLALFLASCSSAENKAKKAIKEELKLTMHDFKSYEPVQFGKLEIAMSSWEDSPVVHTYLKKSEEFSKAGDEYSKMMDLYDYDHSCAGYLNNWKLALASWDSSKTYLDKIDNFQLYFVAQPIGWQMTHSFRGKSFSGNFGLDQYLFILDKELTKVIKSIDLSE